jgi:TfoX/Sxy family transcriptional regulator of competence genes
MPKADPSTATLFRTLLPNDPRVTVRPMFGHTAAFVNGLMFAGTFGRHVFARLNAALRAELLAVPGSTVFAPMKGRPMKEYVQLPAAMLAEPAAKQWIARALEWTSTLPPKNKTRPKPAGIPVKPARSRRPK